MKILQVLFTIGALAAFAGCASLPAWFNAKEVPPQFTPVNFHGDAQLSAEIQRVAFLPIHGGGVVPPETAGAMDAVLITALQRQKRFEVVVVSREECQRLFGAADFSSTAALPHGFLEQIAEKYAVEAVLFTDLTVYRANRPLSLGLRSKLATSGEVRLVWAFDEIFSAQDATMVNSVRSYYRESGRSEPVDPTPAVLQSPARFGAVAAELMYRTLPAR